MQLFRRINSNLVKKCMNRFMSDHRTFPLGPSRWQWTKYKDLVHYYVMLGVIPCSLFVGYQNLFVGPAQLSETPENYRPKYWEYYKSPVTRFIARYLLHDPQQDYEKFLSYLFVQQELIRLRQLEKDVLDKMGDRRDYQAWFFKPVAGNYYRITRQVAQELSEVDDPLPNEI